MRCSDVEGKHREPQSIKAKLFLPIIPIGIVAKTKIETRFLNFNTKTS